MQRVAEVRQRQLSYLSDYIIIQLFIIQLFRGTECLVIFLCTVMKLLAYLL